MKRFFSLIVVLLVTIVTFVSCTPTKHPSDNHSDNSDGSSDNTASFSDQESHAMFNEIRKEFCRHIVITDYETGDIAYINKDGNVTSTFFDPATGETFLEEFDFDGKAVDIRRANGNYGFRVLTEDGTVCYKTLEQITDIVSFDNPSHFFAGVKKDGTVVLNESSSSVHVDQSSTENWKDVISISSTNSNTVGLKKDGTVVAVGTNENNECDVSGWRDVVQVYSVPCCTFGLKKDGTVISTDVNFNNEISKLSNVKSLFVADKGHKEYDIYAIHNNGAVQVISNRINNAEQLRYMQDSISKWSDIVEVYWHVTKYGCFLFAVKSDGDLLWLSESDDFNSQTECFIPRITDVRVEK